MDKEAVLKRLLQSIEYLKNNGMARNQAEIADLTGILQPHISSALNGDPKRLSKNFVHKFAKAYSDYINENWLLTGEGEMTKTFRIDLPKKSANQYLDLINAILEEKATKRPHVEARASAGFMDGMSLSEFELKDLIAGMPDYDFTIEAKGLSMLPRIEDGDILCCRKVHDRQNPPIGKICVIDSNDGAAVKIIASEDKNVITLRSLNPDYDDYPIDSNTINGIAEVVGSIRRFV